MSANVAERPAARVTSGARNLSWLGERLDGWADLIEGAAERAPEVVKAFQERISARQMPNVQHESSALTTGGLVDKKRPYQLVHTPIGAAVAVYIGQFGSDLYVAWDLFIRPVWNMMVVWGILGVGAVLGLFQAFGRDPWTGHTRFSFLGWIVATIGLSILFAFLVGGAGLVVKRNPLAFFRKELDAFDADDITAMTLAVHKSLLQAIDVVGIDIHLLRVKEQFRGGRRDRLI
ncbi:MAG TPA: hypothetical protein EYP49_09115 [Anaerolineae bacterium]|nr:hypothetical protein [Anaerolineae bacterium]